MQKKTLRAVCSILAALTVAPMLFSCNNGSTTKDTTNTVVSQTPVEGDEKFEDPGYTYGGADFSIYSAGHVAYEDFGFEAEDATPLGRAQYEREMLINQTYDVNIIFKAEVEKASTNGNGPGYKNIQKAVSSNSVDYHLCIIGGYDVANLAMSNNLYDLNSLDIVDTSKSWWDQNANEDLTINGMLFFTNGSLTAAYSESTFVIYVNKALATEKIPGVDLYKLVSDKQWTIDKLNELSRTVSEDLDGDTVMGKDDRYGLYVWDDSILGMFAAGGTKVATVTEDGTIALTLNTDNTVNMFNKYMDIAGNSAYALRYQVSGYKPTDGVIVAFQKGNALFWATSNTNTAKLRDMESDFGILPYPMLNEEQGRYYSMIAPYNSQFICVPMFLDGMDIYVGHITEALAYNGKISIWPACYEQTLKGAFARDEGTYEMLDIIYSSYGYDIGHYYLIGNYNTVMMNLIRQNSTDFASKYQEAEDNALQKLKTINDNYKEVQSWWE